MEERDDSRIGSPTGQQYAGTLRELRSSIADADRRIDRLMVIRRRQLAAARSRRYGK
jgi:hypothetical protein